MYNTMNLENPQQCLMFSMSSMKKKKKHHLGATTSFSTFPHHCTLHYTDDTFVMITESGLVGQSKMNSSA